MRQFLVTKMDGTRQPYDRRKVLRSILATGLEAKVAESIAQEVEKKLYDRIPTKELYYLLGQAIEAQGSLKHRCLYRLREALSELDSLKFEWYLTEVLRAHGYQAEWNKLILGAGVQHQVDIVAKQGKVFWLVEVKHHVEWHKMSGLGEVLQVQARLEDIEDGRKQGKNTYQFTGAWLMNNTKFSQHAKDYAAYRKIKLSGWHQPENNPESLENLIQAKGLYPITILNIPTAVKNALQEENVVTLNDILVSLVKRKITYDWQKLKQQAQLVLGAP